jgi:ABC-type multidrug transport system ATPase subunit
MIDVDQLVVKYRSHRLRRPTMALDGLDLRVEEGDFFALLGQNGAGKSTALYCMLGLLRPTAGRVLVFGSPPEPGGNVFRDIGYLPEEPHYPAYLTVEEALHYYGSLNGVPSLEVRTTELLDRLGLLEHRRMRIASCSKGMKQKLGIAQCLIHRPRLLLLDEPMRGLDPTAVHVFREILVEMNRQGATVVMSSHLLGEVEMVARRAAIIHRGRLVVQDTVSSLVAGDTDTYAVEVDGAGEVPPLLADGVSRDGRLTGSVAAERLYDFMDYAREHRLSVVSCARKRATLEDTFLRIIEEQGHV